MAGKCNFDPAMPAVVFVVPFAMEATMRFVRAGLDLPGVAMAIVTQDAVERFPEDVRRRAAGFARVRDALDPDELERGVRAAAPALGHRVDTLLGILEPLQVPLAIVRERLGVPGMDAKTARNFRDKARMKDLLAAHGLPCAAHRLCASPAEALAFANEIGLPLVVKPPAGAGAKNTFRVDTLADLEGYLRATPPTPRAPVLFEEFLRGREYSFDSITLRGRHVFHSITEYHPTPLEVMREPWIQWAVLLPRRIDGPEFHEIREAGPRALSVLGMVTGMSHMEWFRREDDSIAISEVAARPPGAQFTTLHSWAHDLDFYRAWVRLMVFEEFEPPERRWAVGAAFLRGQGDGHVRRVLGVEQIQAELGELVVEARLPEPGQPRASSYEGEGYVVVRHPETEVVREALRRIVSVMRVEVA